MAEAGRSVVTLLRGSVLGAALSPREAQVQRLIDEGKRCVQIARELGVDSRTVCTFKQRINQKLGIEPRPLPQRDFDYRRAFRAWERSYMRALMRRTGYNISKAAALAGLNRTHMYKLRRRVARSRAENG